MHGNKLGDQISNEIITSVYVIAFNESNYIRSTKLEAKYTCRNDPKTVHFPQQLGALFRKRRLPSQILG